MASALRDNHWVAVLDVLPNLILAVSRRMLNLMAKGVVPLPHSRMRVELARFVALEREEWLRG